MFVEFNGYFNNPIIIKIEEVEAVRADVQLNKVRDDLTIIHMKSGNQYQVRENVYNVLKIVERRKK